MADPDPMAPLILADALPRLRDAGLPATADHLCSLIQTRAQAIALLARALDYMSRDGSPALPAVTDLEWDALISEGRAFLKQLGQA